MNTPRPTVLLVDDDDAIRDNLAPYLERSGFDVHTASDGLLGLDAIRSIRPDVVVLDVLMPGLDGREVLRRLRADDEWTPVVLLTQVGESFERAAALEEGADDYLNKPFDPQELLARLRAILRRLAAGMPQLTTSARLVSGDLSIDRVARRVRVGDEERALTSRAFSLLEFLMTHPDEVITRDRLLATVWGYDFAVTSRAVDHRVAELRRVLQDDGRWIETVQGLGYRFDGAVERA